MPFLRGTDRLRATLVHHTGTMVRFVPSQLLNLPTNDVDCAVYLPDGQERAGHFRRNPANPYLAGPGIVRWIKGWVGYGGLVEVVVRQVGIGLTVRIELASQSRVAVDVGIKKLVRLRARRIARDPAGLRRRGVLERWERDPALRQFVIAAWGDRCQVQGCRVQRGLPAALAGRVVDVHHLAHVSAGGSDSPMNLCVLCTAHHALIHRGGRSSVESSDLDGARVRVNGEVLTIGRDVRRLFAEPISP